MHTHQRRTQAILFHRFSLALSGFVWISWQLLFTGRGCTFRLQFLAQFRKGHTCNSELIVLAACTLDRQRFLQVLLTSKSTFCPKELSLAWNPKISGGRALSRRLPHRPLIRCDITLNLKHEEATTQARVLTPTNTMILVQHQLNAGNQCHDSGEISTLLRALVRVGPKAGTGGEQGGMEGGRRSQCHGPFVLACILCRV